MTADAVVSLVSGLWPVYTGDRVKVELLDRASSCPVRAMVMFDGSSWRVLADQALTPRDLLFYLAHELGHVVNGDAARVGTVEAVDRQRDVFRGVRSALAEVGRQAWRTRGQVQAVAVEEQQANQFAVTFFRTWSPVLETVDRVVKDAVRKGLHYVRGTAPTARTS